MRQGPQDQRLEQAARATGGFDLLLQPQQYFKRGCIVFSCQIDPGPSAILVRPV